MLHKLRVTDVSHPRSMKITKYLALPVLALCLIISMILGMAASVNAESPNMTEIFEKLSNTIGISKNDYDNYNSQYSASLPIVYNQNANSHYLALGGITAGGLAVVTSENCYANQIANKLGVKYTNRAEKNLTSTGAVAYVQRYVSDITAADLITFQLDGASFISSGMSAAIAGKDVNWEKYLNDSDVLNYINSFRTQIISEYGAQYGEANASRIAKILEYMLYECVAYGFETLNVIDEIRRYNTDATVIVLGLYNPLRGLSFTAEGKNMDISKIFDEIIDFCNIFLFTHTKDKQNTAFVEASGASTTGYGNVTLSTSNEMALAKELYRIVSATQNQYADANGHNYIRDQVTNALYKPCKHSNTAVKNTVKATCTNEGYTGDTVCNDCGNIISYGSPVPKNEHTYGEWKSTTAPSCTTEGILSRSCSACSNTETKSVKPTGHTWDNGTVTKKPDCLNEGIKTITCTACGESRTETIPANGHDWDNGAVTKEATCTSEGEKAVTCKTCGTASVEKIPVKDHAWDNGTVTKEATCTSDGERAVTCKTCGTASVEKIPATGHTWDDGAVTKEPDCETEGEKAVTCKTCGTASTEPIPPLGHDWEDVSVVIEPTCEAEGSKTVKCKTCGKEDSDVIPPTGHKFTHYTPNNDGTCSKDGTKTGVCDVCGVSETFDDPNSRTSHNFEDGKCTFCGEKQPDSFKLWWIPIIIVAAGAIAVGLYFLVFKKKRAVLTE